MSATARVDDQPTTLRLDGEASDLVLYFSGSRWEGPPGHDRRMAEALSAHAPVLFVEPPISPITRFRHPSVAALSDRPALKVLNPRLAHYVPVVVPGQTRPLMHRLVPGMMRRGARRAVRALYPGDSSPVAAVVSSRLEPLLDAVPAHCRLYYATDDLVAGSAMLGLPQRRLMQQELAACAAADAIAVVSTSLVERYADAGFPATFVPNGCSPELFAAVDFAPLPDDVTVSGPIAGFVGTVNDRIDLSLLEAVATRGISLLIVGPVSTLFDGASRFSALCELPNVLWVGPKAAEQMPSYLRIIDVGLTPYAQTPFNKASFPLKTLEYLAAGRPVVATTLDAHLWLDTELIDLADKPVAFADFVEAALARPRTGESIQTRQQFAQGHSWEHRATQLAGLLDLPLH